MVGEARRGKPAVGRSQEPEQRALRPTGRLCVARPAHSDWKAAKHNCTAEPPLPPLLARFACWLSSVPASFGHRPEGHLDVGKHRFSLFGCEARRAKSKSRGARAPAALAPQNDPPAGVA